VPGEQINYPELSQEIHRHLYYTHHNTAAGGLTEEEALEQHWQEHHGPGGLRNHEDPPYLHAWQTAYVRGSFADRLEKLEQDATDVLAQVDSALSDPVSWTKRRRPSWGAVARSTYLAWKKTLTRDEQWSHCGNADVHDAHKHTVTFSGETPNPDVSCIGTPDIYSQPEPLKLATEEMAGEDLDVFFERMRAMREGSQPLPVPRSDAAGAHDMVLSDLRGIFVRRQAALRRSGQTKEAEAVRKLLKEIETDLLERRALGLRRYGSLLQPGNGRDPLRDAYEEVVDLVAYFKQLMMARDEAVTVLVELLNDHAIGEDPVLREKIGRVMYLLAGQVVDKEGSNDVSG
jgi:hypothetical protein